MFWIRTFLLVTAIQLFSHSLLAQSSRNVQRGNFQWLQYFNHSRLSEKWTFLLDGGYRWGSGFSIRSQYIVRAAFGYRLGAYSSVSVGFAHLGFYGTDGIAQLEYRPHQQFRTAHFLGKVRLSHRVRAEQRFFKEVENGKLTGNTSFNHRFRYLFMFKIPLLASETREGRQLSAFVGNEILLRAGKDVQGTFAQNRILVGPGFSFGPKFEIALLYHGLYGALDQPGEFVYFDIAWLRLRHRVDFRKQ